MGRLGNRNSKETTMPIMAPTYEQDLEMLEGLCDSWEDVMRIGIRPDVDRADLRLVRRVIERSRQDIPTQEDDQ